MGRGQPLNQGKLQDLTFLDEGNLSHQQSTVRLAQEHLPDCRYLIVEERGGNKEGVKGRRCLV